MHRLLLGFLIAVLWSESIYAQRVMRLPVYPKRSYGVTAPISTLYPASKSTVAEYFALRIILNNLSSTAQTGKVVIRNDSAFGAWTDSGSSPTLVVFPPSSIRFYACNNFVNFNATNYEVRQTIPAGGLAANFTIGANGSAEYAIGVILEVPRVPSQSIGFDYTIRGELVINEDRGAVSGSILPFVGGGYPGNKMCYGEDLSNLSVVTLEDGASTPAPMEINGGRPF